MMMIMHAILWIRKKKTLSEELSDMNKTIH